MSHAMCRVEVPRNRGDAQFGFEWSGSIEAPCARMSALPVLTGRFGADAMSEMGRWRTFMKGGTRPTADVRTRLSFADTSRRGCLIVAFKVVDNEL